MPKLHLQRQRLVIEAREATTLDIEGKRCVQFCSNDYLNLAQHPEVKKTFAEHATIWGAGSGSAVTLSGYSKQHAALEEELATFLNRERALLFNSGYHANLGVITSLASRSDLIVADKYCHASLNDAALLSRATFLRYHHQDTEHANALLQNPAKKKYLITESIFGMQGSICNIGKLAEIAQQHQAMLIVDDAHGMGIHAQHFEFVPCLITTFGKALGSIGAVVSGKADMIEHILQTAKTYLFTTSLPPAICAATRKALAIMQTENWRQEKLFFLSKFFNTQAQTRELTLASEDATPIKSILLPSSETAFNLHQRLFAKGFLVGCIRPPTVPEKLCCLRISLNCLHEENQIVDLLDTIKEEYEKL